MQYRHLVQGITSMLSDMWTLVCLARALSTHPNSHSDFSWRDVFLTSKLSFMFTSKVWFVPHVFGDVDCVKSVGLVLNPGKDAYTEFDQFMLFIFFHCQCLLQRPLGLAVVAHTCCCVCGICFEHASHSIVLRSWVAVAVRLIFGLNAVCGHPTRAVDKMLIEKFV